ncbi:imidazole glycerol phosphate synthase subunit HisH [Jatrophihabitans sp. DSM 45814]
MRIVVLDYGSGNVRSAVRALEKVGGELIADSHGNAGSITVDLTADSRAAIDADGLLVPGVGAFAACMAGLNAVGAQAILRERLDAARPVLGICVGMQVLFEAGIEHGIETAGLGFLPGRVEQLRAPVIPHMGWNTVDPAEDSALFAGVAQGTRFYFVHSYAVHSATGDSARTNTASSIQPFKASLTEHGESFVAAAESGPLWATQFHPEKSGAAGQELLRNWLRSLPAFQASAQSEQTKTLSHGRGES